MYIIDELKFVKKFLATVDSNNKKILTFKNDFYVNPSFTEDKSNYCLTNKMLYQGFQSYLCQEKGEETEDLALVCQPEGLGIDEELMADIYPLKSRNWLMYYGVKEADDPNKREYEALLIPEYNQPKVIHLNPNDVSYYKMEYFFYHDNDYLVYHKQTYGLDHVAIEIYKRNGLPHQRVKLTLEGCNDHSYAKVLVSPSGRYMFIAEKDILKDAEKANPSEQGVDNPEEDKTVGKVLELVMDKDTKEFRLETKHRIEDFKERYNQSHSDFNTYSYYGTSTYFLTDKMEILCLNKTDNYVMYEEIKVQDELKEKFGKNEYDKEKFNTLNDINVEMKNGGFTFYTQEEVHFLRIDSEHRTVMPLIKVNFKINKGQMTINKVCPCPDPKLIIIAFCKEYTDYLLLVWDIEENREVYNFSTTNTWSFIYGPGSKAGFILNGDTYVNLDKGLINYFFEYDFNSNAFYEQVSGYRINKDQDLVLEYGNIITKETLIEVASVDELKDGYEKITEENINLERIRFQVNGNTSLHFFALEYETLSLILDYMEEHRPEYLTSILMKNNKNKSPLDITLDNESPKNTEILLRKLTNFNDSSLSILFYDRFPELLAMNITAFHEYLDSCFFQTVQMKATKYLKLNQDKDPWLVPHSSCLIDEVFIEKYCQNDEKKNMEKEKQKKEEEDKKKAEEDKVAEEQKRLDEENKTVNLNGENAKEEEKQNPDELNKNSIMDRDSDQDLLELDEVDTKKPKTKEELELEKERRKQKRLDIRAIEFDWIFNKHDGSAFMRTLAETDCIDLFSLTIIRHIVKFCWSYFRKYIIIYLLIPYILYFSIFIVYATYFHKKQIENDDGRFERFGLGSFISIIFLLLFIIYFSWFEFLQIKFHKASYFVSFWNMIDLASLVLNLVIVICDLAGIPEADLVPMFACAVLIMWFKVFYFGRMFFSTAAMIRMVLEITLDMKYFLLVLIIAIAGFGNFFFIMARNYGTDELFTGDNYWRAFLYSYNQAMGNFDTAAYLDPDKYYLFIIWFMNTMITLIIFLNLLIAIMGDTFDRVQETVDNNILKELSSIMLENEMLINRKKIFGDAKYIIVIQEEKAEESTASWEGRLQHLKKFMDKSVQEQNKLLKDLELNISDTIKEKAEKRAKEMETR